MNAHKRQSTCLLSTLLLTAFVTLATAASNDAAPKPSREQAAWQQLEIIAFAHFGINTFTDREWGEGKEDPALFNPAEFNADQWVRALKAGRARLLILTCKHHDGFCLWPSQFTEHSVKNSPWRGGGGDVVREVSAACRKGGLKFGVYLSPWDRHERTYGDSPAYNQYFRNQLRELLTNYGDVTEVWFDGACAEGPNGKRQEYDWASYYQLVRKLQPKALIAICGPDIRWVGNEDGLARVDETSVQAIGTSAWQTFHRPPGAKFIWYPAECDVSIRPGWFYHAKEDEKVKSVAKLLDIYYQSVGRNSVLLLNVPPDRRGRIHENDVKRLAEFGAEIQRRFGRPLAETRGSGKLIVLKLRSMQTVDHVILQEEIAKGEQVKSFVLETLGSNDWKELRRGKVIGQKQIIAFEAVTTTQLRLRVLQAEEKPALTRFAAFMVGTFPAPNNP